MVGVFPAPSCLAQIKPKLMLPAELQCFIAHHMDLYQHSCRWQEVQEDVLTHVECAEPLGGDRLYHKKTVHTWKIEHKWTRWKEYASRAGWGFGDPTSVAGTDCRQLDEPLDLGCGYVTKFYCYKNSCYHPVFSARYSPAPEVEIEEEVEYDSDDTNMTA